MQLAGTEVDAVPAQGNLLATGYAEIEFEFDTLVSLSSQR
jgi:hypothetical protein